MTTPEPTDRGAALEAATAALGNSLTDARAALNAARADPALTAAADLDVVAAHLDAAEAAFAAARRQLVVVLGRPKT